MLFVLLVVYTLLCVSNNTPVDPYTIVYGKHTFKLYNSVEPKEVGILYVVSKNNLKEPVYTDLWWSLKVDNKINFKRLIKAVRHICKERRCWYDV